MVRDVVAHMPRAGMVLAAALLAAAGASTVSASNAIRPAPGTPDPRFMVLESDDLGRAKVTRQRYFKDTDFPSVISYVREFEDGSSGGVPLPYVESQAEVGKSAATSARFLVALRIFFASKEARKFIAESFVEGLGDEVFVTDIRIGRPRALGVGPGSFDLVVTARLLGRPIDFHVAAFSVERVLGLLTVVGAVGQRVSLRVMKRLATIMAARTVLELVPQNLARPSISGSPMLGQTLTANPGRWTGNPARYAYRWERCSGVGTSCSGITGATGRTYVVAEADVGGTLRVAVRARGIVTSDLEASTPTDVVAVFVDTFSSSGLSAAWRTSITGSGPTVTQANGQLEITLPAGTALGPEGYAIASVFSSCRFPGDFDMQVDYLLLSGLMPIAGINLGFEAAEFTGGSYSGQHGLFIGNQDGIHRISTHFPHPGVLGLPYNSFVPDSSRAGTLRLVRTTSGGVTTMTVSRVTGSPWSFTSQPYPYTVPTNQAANLNLFTNVTPLPSEIRVAFDNFRVSSGAWSCP
jgi:hypothetical protein